MFLRNLNYWVNDMPDNTFIVVTEHSQRSVNVRIQAPQQGPLVGGHILTSLKFYPINNVPSPYSVQISYYLSLFCSH